MLLYVVKTSILCTVVCVPHGSAVTGVPASPVFSPAEWLLAMSSKVVGTPSWVSNSFSLSPSKLPHIPMTCQESEQSLKSPPTRLFLQHVNIKDHIKDPHHWSLLRGNHRSPVDSPHNGTVMWKIFLWPCHDVTVTHMAHIVKSLI